MKDWHKTGAKYILCTKKDEDISTCNVKKQIMILFVRNRSKHYKEQLDIQLALENMGLSHSQGTISKALKELKMFPFEYKGCVFAICLTPKGYTLLGQDDYPKSLRYLLIKDNLLCRDIVFYEHSLPTPQMFIFWVTDDPDKKEKVVDLFRRALSGAYIDIFYIENRLVILLDSEAERFTPLSKLLKNFFDKGNNVFMDVPTN